MDPLPCPGIHGVLNTIYGSRCHRTLEHLTSLLRKTAVSVAGLVFLLRCRRCNVFPSFISRTVNFPTNGIHLQRLAARLPRHMLATAIRDARLRVAALQKDLDATWVALTNILTDSRFWNALVQQKDNYYSAKFMAASWRLQKKFVRLFHIIPNDSYCDQAADAMLEQARKSRTDLQSPQVRSPSDISASSSKVADSDPIISDRQGSSTPKVLQNSSPVRIERSQQSSTLHWGPPAIFRSPTEVFLESPELPPYHYSPVLWPSPVPMYNKADSQCSSGLWYTPGSVPIVSDPEILQFSSLSSNRLISALDLAFVESPSLDSAALTRSHSLDSIPSAAEMDRDTRSMSTPEGRQKRWEAVNRRRLSVERRQLDFGMLSSDTTRSEEDHLVLLEDLPSSQVSSDLPVSCSAVLKLAHLSDIPRLVENDSRVLGDVANLSSTILSQKQLDALNSSTKFRQNPRNLPILELVAGIEAGIRTVEEFGTNSFLEFRALCADVLRKAPKPPKNLPDQLSRTLRSLANNEQLMITTADKGGKLAVINSAAYANMCYKHLDDSAYERIYSIGTGRNKIVIDEGPNQLFSDSFLKPDVSDRLVGMQCHRLTNMLAQMVKSGDISSAERKLLIPGQPYTGTISHFYGLLKLHKLGELQLRPIISTCGLYLDKMMVKQKAILNCLLWGTTSLKNSYEFAYLLQHFKFGPDDIMASFDVSSLFTKVPVPETLAIVEQRLEEVRQLESDPLSQITSLTNAGIMKLLKLALEECYFTYDGLLYKQKSGLPMGGRLSPILANIFMEHFEYTVLCSSPIVPKMWFWYVDDIFIVWNKKLGSIDDFLHLLNKQHPNIVLTAEFEEDHVLPFLDVLVKKDLILF